MPNVLKPPAKTKIVEVLLVGGPGDGERAHFDHDPPHLIHFQERQVVSMPGFCGSLQVKVAEAAAEKPKEHGYTKMYFTDRAGASVKNIPVYVHESLVHVHVLEYMVKGYRSRGESELQTLVDDLRRSKLRLKVDRDRIVRELAAERSRNRQLQACLHKIATSIDDDKILELVEKVKEIDAETD